MIEAHLLSTKQIGLVGETSPKSNYITETNHSACKEGKKKKPERKLKP
jgi:hypothetical protein